MSADPATQTATHEPACPLSLKTARAITYSGLGLSILGGFSVLISGGGTYFPYRGTPALCLEEETSDLTDCHTAQAAMSVAALAVLLLILGAAMHIRLACIDSQPTEASRAAALTTGNNTETKTGGIKASIFVAIDEPRDPFEVEMDDLSRSHESLAHHSIDSYIELGT